MSLPSVPRMIQHRRVRSGFVADGLFASDFGCALFVCYDDFYSFRKTSPSQRNKNPIHIVGGYSSSSTCSFGYRFGVLRGDGIAENILCCHLRCFLRQIHFVVETHDGTKRPVGGMVAVAMALLVGAMIFCQAILVGLLTFARSCTPSSCALLEAFYLTRT
jgi:hypothetical protein